MSEGFRTTANKRTRYTADDCKDKGLHMSSEQPPNGVHYHWQWADTFHGGKNIDIFEDRNHIAIAFTVEDAKRIIMALKSRPAPAPEVCEEHAACRIPVMCPETAIAAQAERVRIIKMLESWNPFQRTFGNVLESIRGNTDSNPCEENGCTDTDGCDEICDNRRIYSPAQMREAVSKAREDVLEVILLFSNTSSRIVDLNGECGDESSDMIDAEELKYLINSLRTPEQEQPR